MAKMVAETVTRYRCYKCNYVTFVKPLSGNCPNCSYAKELSIDDIIIPRKAPKKKTRKKYIRKKRETKA